MDELINQLFIVNTFDSSSYVIALICTFIVDVVIESYPLTSSQKLVKRTAQPLRRPTKQVALPSKS